MDLVKQPGVKLSFRKEEFEIVYHSYVCKDSGEQFTNETLDRINLTQIHNKYREKYGIPFPEEIKSIREQYGTSASKMSEILGFGTNSYRLYESGEIPSVANGRLILAVKHPKDFIKQVEASSHLLDEKEKLKYLTRAELLLEEHRRRAFEIQLSRHIFKSEYADRFSGYRSPGFRRIANMIRFISERAGYVFKTKLNKLLFYADFGHFKRSGFSISGLSYRAIQMGPVPSAYGLLYDKLANDELIEITNIPFSDGNYGEALVGLTSFEDRLFNESELTVLNLVAEQFSGLRASEIIELSHQESAWIDNEKDRSLISYPEYAFELKGL